MLGAKDVDVRQIAKWLTREIMEDKLDSFTQRRFLGNNDVQPSASLDEIFISDNTTLHTRQMKIKLLPTLFESFVKIHWVWSGEFRAIDGVLTASIMVQAIKGGDDRRGGSIFFVKRTWIQPWNIQNVGTGRVDEMLHFNAAVVVCKRNEGLAEWSSKHEQ